MKRIIIKQFKKIEKDVTTFCKKKRELNDKYRYLNIIDPMPKERVTVKNTYFRRGYTLIIPERINMNYGKSETLLSVKHFNIQDSTFKTESLTLERFKEFDEITEDEALEMLAAGKNFYESRFDTSFSIYMEDLYKKMKVK